MTADLLIAFIKTKPTSRFNGQSVAAKERAGWTLNTEVLTKR